MKYMLLIYGGGEDVSEERQQAEMAAWFQYDNDIRASGKFVSGEALHPASSATTLRLVAERPQVIDGPFTETKEQLGGYYVIDADNLDDALAWAGKMPHVPYGGSVEVRPVMVF